MLTQEFNIDIIPSGVPIIIHVTQYDVGLRTYIFRPFTSAGESTPVVGSATLEGTKPDGNAFQQACSYSNGIITYVLQEQLAVVAGRVWSRLVLRDLDGNVISSTAIVWAVEIAGIKDTAVVSDSDLSALQRFLDEFGTIDAYRQVLENKQDALTFDNAPTQNSTNPVTSGGIYTAIQNARRNINAATVNGHTVETNVPANAVFTDTTYTAITEAYIASLFE